MLYSFLSDPSVPFDINGWKLGWGQITNYEARGAPGWYPGSGKADPSSNLLTHQGRYVQLFRLHTAQGATSKGILITLWTFLLFKKKIVHSFIDANKGPFAHQLCQFSNSGNKGTCSNKISIMQLSQLLLMVVTEFEISILQKNNLYC